MALFCARSAQYRGRMDRGGNVRRPTMRHEIPALLGKPVGAAQHSLGSSGAQAHHHYRFDYGHLGFEPWIAGGDFRRGRFLVDAPLAALLKLEVLYRIGEIDSSA